MTHELVYDGYIKIQKTPENYERVVHPGAVAIVAHDRDHIYFVKQPRPAIGNQRIIELPAGTIEPNEPPLITAQRELWEEVGALAHRWEKIDTFYSSPGWTTEQVTLYRATDLEFVEAAPTAEEDIEIVKWPIEDIKTAIAECKSVKCKLGLVWLYSGLKGWQWT